MAIDPDAHCRNCGSPLYGEHCYACGQPTKGLVRHFGSILGDAVDTLFNLDGRIVRTLPPLLLRPGFLSMEYFEGHRVRYVSPVRLFIVLCLATFFAAKLATPSFNIGKSSDGGDGGDSGVRISADGVQGGDSFEALDSVEAVESRLAEARAEMAKARAGASGVPGMGIVLDRAEAEVAEAAQARIAELRAAEASPGAPRPDAAEAAASAPPPIAASGSGPNFSVDENSDTPDINFNGKPWHAETNPVVIEALPDGANRWLNAQIGHIPENWKRIRQDPDLLRNAFYSMLPTALFVLVPVFALLLKLVYLLKRRLYMEHLVVALHGHAFVCAVLLVMMALTGLEALLAPPAWLAAALGWLEWALLLWVPVYLWLQLRRVYGQGVLLTSVAFAVLAFAQLLLLSVVVTGAMVAALVWL